jgi:cobalt-zinc-cadmium efflux system protein
MHTHDAHLPWCENESETCNCESSRYIYAASICIVIIAIQILGWWYSESLALLGDTGHVGVDFLGLSTAAIIALKVAKKRSEENAIRTGGLAIQATLLAVVVGWLFLGAWERFHHPINIVPLPLIIAATIGLLLNILQLKILHPGFANKNMRAARLHALQDLLSSIGVVASGIIIWIFGWVYTDPIVSAGIGLWLAWQIYLLLKGKHAH